MNKQSQQSPQDTRPFFAREMFLSGLILLLVVVLSLDHAFDTFDWKLFDTFVTFHRKKPVHRDNVIFVCIDQKSIDLVNSEWGIGWPWPREFHGLIVDYLAKAGAKAVIFDVIFSEQDIDRFEVSAEESDGRFSEAIAKSGITYLAVVAQEGMMSDRRPSKTRFYIDSPGPLASFPNVKVYDSAVFPIDTFAQGAHGLGLVNMEPDSDGIHRRYPLVSKLGSGYVPSLAFAVVSDVMSDEDLNHTILDRIDSGLWFDDEGKFNINWYGNGGTGRGGNGTDAVFRYYSYSAVHQAALIEMAGETSSFDPSVFRDKIIIIGSNAPGLFDLKATPFTHENLYPGMEIHATAIENMLAGDMLPRLPRWIGFALMTVITVFLYLVDRKLKNLRVLIIISAILIAFEFTVGYMIYVSFGHVVHMVEVLASTTFVFSGLVISGYFNETKEKRLLRRSFGRYVNETVMNDILANPTAVDFRGRAIDATIMATDIAGFTTISEKLPAQEVVKRLNDYLSEVSETLIDNRAYINKYIGDAILALYGAFGEADHMRNACSAALRAREVVQRKVELARSRNEEPMVTRFGITTGEMTMGNIGSERKIEYTVIGDTVNTAFRFEGLNKFYKTTIIVGERTRNGAVDDFEFRELDMLRVKGKETPETVYELIGMKGSVPPESLRMRDEFESALALYRSRKFTEAKAVFDRLYVKGDPTSGVFAERCADFMANEPAPDWNGVWVMLRK